MVRDYADTPVDPAIIDRALEKNLEKRFQTGAECAEAIRKAMKAAPANAVA